MHQGEADITRHSSSEHHISNLKTLKSNTFKPINQDMKDKVSYIQVMFISVKVTRAEIKVTNLLVQHNVPLSIVDHLSPHFCDIFADSNIAKS